MPMLTLKQMPTSNGIVTKINMSPLVSSLLCPNYVSIKFGKNPTTGSQDNVQARKCHANADAKPMPTSNGICTKINMPPSP